MNRLIILLLVLLASCNFKSTHKPSSVYKEFASKCHIEFIDHFPQTIPNSFQVMAKGLLSISAFDFDQIFVMYHSNVRNLEIIIDTIIDKSLVVYKASDELLVLNSTNSLEDMGIAKKEYRKNMPRFNYLADKGELPVPNFSFLELDTYFGEHINNPCKLSDDFSIYILEAEPGVKVRPIRSCEYLMPERWKNGYSKGIAISMKEQLVIYYFVSW